MTLAGVVLLGIVLVAGLGWRRRCLALVAQASHELRGPLQSALLGLHGLSALTGEGATGRVAAVDLELRRAALALEDLSAAARGRRPRETVGAVDVGALLAEAGPAWEVLAADAGVALRVERPAAPLLVRADRLRVAQALGNLVANAVEHGGGAVWVRVRPPHGGRVGVEVTDGGAGLPAPVAELVGAARGRSGRRGHGLALAAGIAERCGGRLTSAPSPHGARLVLELPPTDGALTGGGRLALGIGRFDLGRRRALRFGRADGGKRALTAPAESRAP